MMADKITLFLINELIIHTKKLVVVKSFVSCVNEHAKMACLACTTLLKKQHKEKINKVNKRENRRRI